MGESQRESIPERRGVLDKSLLLDLSGEGTTLEQLCRSVGRSRGGGVVAAPTTCDTAGRRRYMSDLYT